jgi:hypothetical protein
MPKMLDLVRACALPSHQMMSAAKGALRVSAAEMVEILVHLAEHNKIFAEQARMTLAAWDEAASRTIASDPTTPQEVLEYWLNAKNLRPALFPLLIENPAVSISKLAELAGALKGEWIDRMLASFRIQGSPQILAEMAGNKDLSAKQNARLQQLVSAEPARTQKAQSLPLEAAPEPVSSSPPEGHSQIQPSTQSETPVIAEAGEDPEIESALVAFFAEHANEIAAEGNKPFQAIGGIFDEIHAAEPVQAMAASASATAAPSAPASPAATDKPAAGTLAPLHRKIVNPDDEKRGSTLQKIAKLDVKGRIQLAMKGSKEERSILVRDGTKIVALAVLDSPKITDGEVEKFATQKNVLEAVLRAIPMKRRFAKNYAVVRNLTFNPRTPLDVSLGLMKNLLVQDLRNLAGNKEVAETIRKLALRMFKQKSEAANKKS